MKPHNKLPPPIEWHGRGFPSSGKSSHYGTRITESAVRELLGRSAAEMIYGTTLRLPGEVSQKYIVDAHIDLDNYSDKLRVAMSRLCLCPSRDSPQNNIFQCNFVKNRNCTVSNRPLRRPIQGHHKERQCRENPDKRQGGNGHI